MSPIIFYFQKKFIWNIKTQIFRLEIHIFLSYIIWMILMSEYISNKQHNLNELNAEQ